jgi:hypothetical protein
VKAYPIPATEVYYIATTYPPLVPTNLLTRAESVVE